MRRRGFTLLEILIAIAILAFITVFTAQSIQTALRNRTKIQGEIESLSSVRDALRVMENDINRAFNYRDINIMLYNETAKERNKRIEEAKNKTGAITTAPGTPPPAADPYASLQPLKLKEEKVLTQFIGEANRLDFTSLSNARISSEERTSDQAEIGYFLKDCRSRRNRERFTNCLYRRVSPFLDEDVTAGGEETALLEDVTRLEFRYLGAGEQVDWVQQWLTNERGDERTKASFPKAVEVTIEVENKETKATKPVRMTMVAAIRNPYPPSKPEAQLSEGKTAQ